MAMGKSTHFSIGNIYLQMVDVSLILHCHFWCFRVYDSLYMNAFIHSYTAQVPGNAGLQPTLGTKGDQNRNQTSRRSLYQEFPTCYMLGSIGMHLHDFHHFKSVYILDGIQSHLEPQPHTLIWVGKNDEQDVGLTQISEQSSWGFQESFPKCCITLYLITKRHKFMFGKNAQIDNQRYRSKTHNEFPHLWPSTEIPPFPGHRKRRAPFLVLNPVARALSLERKRFFCHKHYDVPGLQESWVNSLLHRKVSDFWSRSSFNFSLITVSHVSYCS